jgi:divalent metal cation (Fe/Co/Zn/Cd) transporter
VAILLETFSFRTAIVEANKVRGDSGWWAFIRRSKNPELPVVLLEDLGALVGLVLALAGVTIAHLTEDPMWDGIGTLSIGVLLLVISAILAFEMKGLLIGETADETVEEQITAAITSDPDVEALIHLRTQHLGPDELLVGAKVCFAPTLTVAGLADAINRLESTVRAAVPTARVLYVEPDLLRAVEGT